MRNRGWVEVRSHVQTSGQQPVPQSVGSSGPFRHGEVNPGIISTRGSAAGINRARLHRTGLDPTRAMYYSIELICQLRRLAIGADMGKGNFLTLERGKSADETFYICRAEDTAF